MKDECVEYLKVNTHINTSSITVLSFEKSLQVPVGGSCYEWYLLFYVCIFLVFFVNSIVDVVIVFNIRKSSYEGCCDGYKKHYGDCKRK